MADCRSGQPALMMLDQPPNWCQDNSLPAAEQSSATADPPTISDDVFCLRDSCNVVDQKKARRQTDQRIKQQDAQKKRWDEAEKKK
jgi:hypothetical protein